MTASGRRRAWIWSLAICGLAAQTGYEPLSGQDLLESLAATVDATPLYQVGRVDGESCDVFGRIVDATISPQGRLYVLDSQWRRVSILNESGACIGSIGRNGSGPGEFARPERLLLKGDTLYVLDPGNGRIERFGTRGLDFERLASVPLPVSAIDMCFLGSRFFLLSAIDEYAVHEVDLSGRLRKSFGRMDESGDATLRVVSQPGRISCHEGSNSLVVAAKQMPAIHIYSSEGELRHKSLMPGFEPMELVERDGRVVGYRPGPRGFHYTASVLELDPSHAVIQFGGRTQVGYPSPHLVILNLQTGVATPSNGHLPHIYAVEGSWHVIGVTEGLAPQLAVYGARR